jgi:hypothetical protein
MPRISDSIAHSAIYLYSSKKAAEDGQDAGGSGFLVSMPSTPGMVHLYAVTNRHLVDGSQGGNFWTIRLTRKEGGIDCIVTQKDDWFLHDDGDDVAIVPIEPSEGIKWWAVASEKILDAEGVDAFGFGYGDEVFFVGRLISHPGSRRIRRYQGLAQSL